MIIWHERCGCTESACEFDEDCTSPRTVYVPKELLEQAERELTEARAEVVALKLLEDSFRRTLADERNAVEALVSRVAVAIALLQDARAPLAGQPDMVVGASAEEGVSD